MSRMKDYSLDHEPDTDLEMCEYAEYERTLLNDPGYETFLNQQETSRDEIPSQSQL